MGGRQSRKSPRGQIGEQVFAEVEKLTAGGAMKRLAAFNEIANRTGAHPGTVAANYYRIARKRGVPLRPRRSSAPGGIAARGGTVQVVAALRKLEALFQAQEKELAVLRKENRQFEKLRRLLST